MTLIKTSTKTGFKKAIALNAIFLSTVCLTSVAGSLGFVPSAFAQYGLGLPKSASSGGATRSPDSPTVILIVPRDGAKTLVTRPTFYWYISPSSTTSVSDSDANTSDEKSTIKLTFILRNGNAASSAKKIFEAEGKVDKTGLYKFTLPETAPELAKGKVQRWQVRWQVKGGQADVYAPIRRDDNPLVSTAIASAKNDLEKARIYAKNAYWYDAIDAYNSWLSRNPKDIVARSERSDLFKVGLQNHFAFVNVKVDENEIRTEEFDPVRFTNFLTQLDEVKSAMSLALEPKK